MDKPLKMNCRERHIVDGTVVSDESWACRIETEGEEWIAHNVGGDEVTMESESAVHEARTVAYWEPFLEKAFEDIDRQAVAYARMDMEYDVRSEKRWAIENIVHDVSNLSRETGWPCTEVLEWLVDQWNKLMEVD